MLFLPLLFSFVFAENIILFIGDGMGPSVISATRSHYYNGETKLAMDSFPNLALVTTHAKNKHVTDSASAASAIACGQKVNMGSICYPKKNPSLATLAKKQNLTVGIITNTTISHATPAAFYSNAKKRKQEKTIAKQLFSSSLDFFIGGGTEKVDQAASKQKRYSIYRDLKEISSLKEPFVALLSNGHFSFFEKEEDESLLSQSLTKVFDLLIDQKKPFFLIVESGRIDHALHRGDIVTALKETHDFDQMIQKTLEKLKKEKILNKTSVFVTADHDTAGIDLSGYPDRQKPLIKDGQITKSDHDSLPVLRFKKNGKFSQNHTGVNVPLYAKGVCTKGVHGTMDNTKIYHILKSCIENKDSASHP